MYWIDLPVREFHGILFLLDVIFPQSPCMLLPFHLILIGAAVCSKKTIKYVEPIRVVLPYNGNRLVK